jgi:hypothetical protein
MERIHYAGDEFLTGTSIAHAIVEYAAALARKGMSIAIEIPVRHVNGTVGVANFLIGPASQLVSETDDSDGEEIIDEDLVAKLKHETSLLGSSRARAMDPRDQAAATFFELELPTD